MSSDEKIILVGLLVQEREKNIFKLELDIRFGKRQLMIAKEAEAIKIQQMINQWEQMKKGEEQYLKYLFEISKEFTDKHGNGN